MFFIYNGGIGLFLTSPRGENPLGHVSNMKKKNTEIFLFMPLMLILLFIINCAYVHMYSSLQDSLSILRMGT